MLLGDRKEVRIGESIGKVLMKALSFLFVGKLKRYKAIEGEAVALAMVKLSITENQGVSVILSEKLQEIGFN